jgi:hypothetical protein
LGEGEGSSWRARKSNEILGTINDEFLSELADFERAPRLWLCTRFELLPADALEVGIELPE